MYEKSLSCFALGSKVEKESFTSSTPTPLTTHRSLDEESLLDTYSSLLKEKHSSEKKEEKEDDDTSGSSALLKVKKKHAHMPGKDNCVSDSAVTRTVRRKDKEKH